jgi:hypothetical protein
VRKLDMAGMLIGVALAGSWLVGSVGAVLAQDASPTPGTMGAACTAEPRSIDELLPLWFDAEGTPVATPESQTPFQSEAELPQGTPADAETTAAITATIREIFACFDAGQYARAFSLMTDHAVSQFGPDVTDPSEDTPDEVRALLEGQIVGTPIPGETTGGQTIISDARDARVLPDGRVGAIFESGGDRVFALFQQSGDQWLLDDFIDIVEQSTPEAGA